jgi:membrane associated rhomboid family serine protease
VRSPPSLSRLLEFPVAGGVGLLAAAVTVLQMNGRSIEPLTMSSAAFHGEPWRFFTCILPHADFLHLAFNVYWLWVFGALVESVYGHARTLGIVLLLGAGSMAAEYALFHGGIGLSGVGYGLFGLLFVLGGRDRRFLGAVDEQTTKVFVGWFFVCIVTSALHVFPVANVAHGVGALLGGLLGEALAPPASGPLVPVRRGLRGEPAAVPRAGLRRVLAVTGLVVCIAASLAGASVFRDAVNLAELAPWLRFARDLVAT